METYIRTRLDNVLKNQFETILQDCGLSVSAALRLFAENVGELIASMNNGEQ